MAINFEAANMAGYNNPKIEVFKATVAPDTLAVISAPSKTEVIKCVHRGSIPAILVTHPDGTAAFLLWLVMWTSGVSDDAIYFGNAGAVLFYPADSEQPTFQKVTQ